MRGLALCFGQECGQAIKIDGKHHGEHMRWVGIQAAGMVGGRVCEFDYVRKCTEAGAEALLRATCHFIKRNLAGALNRR